MNFLGGLFERKQISQSEDQTAALQRAAGAGSIYSTLASGEWDFERAVKDAHDRVLWVFRCVHAIASKQAGLPIIVREGDDQDGKTVKDDNIHRLLNIRTNSYERAKWFRYRVSAQLLLSPKGVFIERIKANSGRDAALHILPPGTVTPNRWPKGKPNPTGQLIESFTVKTPGPVYEERKLPPEKIIWIRHMPHPDDLMKQSTPLTSARLAIETDWLARLFNRNVLMHDGRPGMLIGIQGRMSQDDARELKNRFGGGPAQAGRVSVIEADGLAVSDLTGNPRDVQWLEAIAGSKEDIIFAFGLSESYLNNASGRTFSNADAEIDNTELTTIVDHCDAVGAGFDVLTEGGLEDNLFVGHDLSRLSAFQRLKKAKEDALQERLDAGEITLDEFLTETGREPWNVPATRVLWLPVTGKMPIAKNDEDTGLVLNQLKDYGEASQAQSAIAGSGQEGTPQGDAGAADQQYDYPATGTDSNVIDFRERVAARMKGLTAKVEVKRKALPSSSDAEGILPAAPSTHPYEELRLQVESKVSGVLTVWSNRQSRSVSERLGHAKVRRGTRHWDGVGHGTKALDPRYAVDLHHWSQELRQDIESALRPVLEREAKKAARELDNAGVIQAMVRVGEARAEGKTALERLTGGGHMAKETLINGPLHDVLDLVDRAAQNQSKRVAELIETMDREGKSLNEIRDAVQKHIGKRGSWHKQLSRHVTTASIEGVKSACYNHASRFVTRTWETEADEKVRRSHWETEGETVSGGKPFVVGKSLLMYPGDPRGPIEETANCRCWITMKADDDAIERAQNQAARRAGV